MMNIPTASTSQSWKDQRSSQMLSAKATPRHGSRLLLWAVSALALLSSSPGQMAFAMENTSDEKATDIENKSPVTSTLRGSNTADEDLMARQLQGLSTEELENIAPTGEASQSTKCHRGGPDRAIDGNTNGNWGNKSVTHTCNNRGDSWWKLDLPRSDFVVKKIVVWNRTDCCSHRLSNSIVEILNDSEEVLGTYDIGDANNKVSFVFDNLDVADASVVRVRKPGNEALSLSEVEVFAPLENVAMTGVASQSSKCHRGNPDRAIDGNTNGAWGNSSVTHTCRNSNGSWWKVDLADAAKTSTIKKIVVWNRVDCCSARLAGSVVEVLNSDGVILSSFDIGYDTDGVQNFKFDVDVEGASAVRVTQPRNEYLSLAEVEIFGSNASGTGSQGGANGLRFSKVGYIGELPVSGSADDILPLSATNFPMSAFDYNILSTRTNGASVVHHQSDAGLDMATVDLINLLGGLPSHPSSDPDNEFWDELEEVVDYQITRRNGPLKDVETLLPERPDIWDGMTLTDGAIAVYNEYPGFWQGKFIETLNADGLDIDNNIIPKRAQTQFLNGIVMLADLNTWSVSTVGPNSFGCKWYAGRIRPEEIAWKISQGEVGVADGVPPGLVNKIKNIPMTSAVDFTAYPDGCPRHPSWPAMHSAASQASFWLSIVLNLTDEQAEQAKKVDYAVAMARTIAGVHYRSDNTFGLNLGQEMVARELPEYLNKMYGSNIDAVRSKIESMRFNWPIY